MKVLILITKSNWGGAQRYVYDLAINLPKSEVDVEVMAGGSGVLIDKLTESNIIADGTLPIGRDISVLDDIKAFFKLLKILRQKKPDVLHINSSKIGGLGALAGRLTGIKKIIFTAHGWAFNEDRSFLSKLLIKVIYWITIILSHKTICVSETLKEQMMYWPFILNKIEVIHNGIKVEPVFSKVNARHELSKLNAGFENFLKKYSGKNLVIIGSIGELHKIKGYTYSIKAIAELIKTHPEKKIVYCIISGGEERKNLEKLIQELGLQESVLLFGVVPSAYQYCKAFDIYLMSSISEGLPYVMLEAGLASLPVVASAVGGIPEIIEDMSSGILIQPKKEREIQHALEFYMSHKRIQGEHSKALNQKILTSFSIDQMIEKTLKVYRTKTKAKHQ